MSLKLKEEMNHLIFNVLIDDDDSSLNIELGTFEKNIKKEVIGVIDFFLSFLTRYDKIITRNMLALKLDFKFKSLVLIYYFINHEQHGVARARNYGRKPCFLCS
jgi:hypothetical protein